MAGENLLHLGRIKGKIEEHAVSGWIAVSGLSFSDHAGATASGVGGSSGVPLRPTDASMSKATDETTTMIFKYCSDGTTLPLVVYVAAEGKAVFYLTDVLIEKCDVTEDKTWIRLHFEGMQYFDNVSGVAARIKDGK